MTSNDLTPQTPQPPSRWYMGVLRFLLFIGLPVAVLLFGAWATVYLLETGPQAERIQRPRRAQLVEVIEVVPDAHRAEIDAIGTVVPSREIVLQPRVSGEILRMSENFVPGGIVRAGDELLAIDPSDYQLAVKKAEAMLAKLKADLREEEGNQTIALKEYELLGEQIREEERDLVLRKPQLDRINAEIAAAQVALDEANVMVERTVVSAPFDAVILERFAERGAFVTPNDRLVTLLGTKALWIEVNIPLAALAWIETPAAQDGKGSAVSVFDARFERRSGPPRIGNVFRILSDMSGKGQLARILVTIEDPLARKPENAGLFPLHVNAVIDVTIHGRVLDSVVALERSLLRDGDMVWVMNNENKLEYRAIDVAFREKNRVLVRNGLSPGERVVSTKLTTAVEGMALRVAEQSRKEDARP